MMITTDEEMQEITESLGKYFDHFYTDLNMNDATRGEVSIAAAILAVGATWVEWQRQHQEEEF